MMVTSCTYIENYDAIIAEIKDSLSIRPFNTHIEDDKLTDAQALIIAKDLNLHSIYNKVLKRYFFRKASYRQLTINELYIC